MSKNDLDIQLLMAIRNKKTIEEIEKLLQNGANPNTQDERGNTPLYYALLIRDIPSVKLLVEYKADPRITNKSKECALDFLYDKESDLIDLIFQNIEENQSTYVGKCFNHLLYACLTANVHLSNRLIDKGIGIFYQDEFGDNCLHKMCQKTQVTPLTMEQLEIVKRLLEKGLDPSIKNEYGDTCFTLCRDNSMLNVLLKDRDLQKTPQAIASGYGRPQDKIPSIENKILLNSQNINIITFNFFVHAKEKQISINIPHKSSDDEQEKGVNEDISKNAFI